MKRRMAQPLIVLPIAAILALTLFVVGLSAQFQPIVPDIGFEIEGNTALDLGGDYDWANLMPPAIRIPDPNSKIEIDPTTFKPNSKFDDPSRWSVLPGKVGPGQSELINFLVWDISPGELGDGRPNDYWLVLGLERIKVPGYFEMDFEYNQVAWDGSSGGLTRTPGDVLVGFELRGKPAAKMAAFKVLLVQYWPGAQPSLCSVTSGPGGEPELVEIGTDPCPPYSDSGWYYRLLADDALSAESGLVQATMNKESFSPPWPSSDDHGNPRDTIGPYEFAEAAINLTALGIEPDCSSPSSVHAKSRSAPAVHSDLKDLVGPVPVVLESEPTRLDGHKFLDVDGDGLWGPDEPPLEGWEIRLSDGSVTYTDAEGYYAFEELAYGTYTVSEVCPQGEDWVQTMPPPDDPNSCGEAVYTVTLDTCTPEVNDLNFGNQKLPKGRLDGHKFLDVDGDGLWGPDEPPLEGWEIRLSDGSVSYTDAEGYYAFEELVYGTYTVSEVCPPGQGWVQTAPGSTDFDTCGSMVHTVALDRGTPEANGLDFGNGQPALSLDKECAQVPDGIDYTIDYTITVANKGNVLLQDIYVEDLFAVFSETIEQLEPGESWTVTGRYPEGVYENTATATAQYAGATVSAEDTATCPPPPTYNLIVTKDAQTSFTRAYQWTLQKTVDNPGPILLYPGDFTEVNYQVVANLGSPAFVDSNWAVEGTITIFNDSELDTPLASVKDVISPDGIDVIVACDCQDVGCVLGPRETATCTYGPVPLPDGSNRTNTVTVTVMDSVQEFTASADIVFDQPTEEIDETIDLEDSQWGFIGQVGWDETPYIFTYPWKIRATGDTCDLFDVPNIATLTTIDTNTVLQDDANVQILEACLTLAYEDLPLEEQYQNDWDYNDLVVEVPIYLEVSDDGDLLAASFEILQTERSTAFTHAFNLQPYAEFFVCSGTYAKSVTVDGVTTTETGEYNPGDNFLLIPDTGEPRDLVELRIDFDVVEPGDCPRDFGSPDPINQYHGEWLFFNPWLMVMPPEVYNLDPYPISVILPPGEPEPRILTVPIAWQPPPEAVHIWNVYPCVQEGNPPIFVPYWWNTDLCMQ